MIPRRVGQTVWWAVTNKGTAAASMVCDLEIRKHLCLLVSPQTAVSLRHGLTMTMMLYTHMPFAHQHLICARLQGSESDVHYSSSKSAAAPTCGPSCAIMLCHHSVRTTLKLHMKSCTAGTSCTPMFCLTHSDGEVITGLRCSYCCCRCKVTILQFCWRV